MIIYIDENLPPQLAEGLNKLQEPLNKRNNTDFEVLSIKNAFRSGVKDEEWIPSAGINNAVAITRDYKIQTTRHQKALCQEYGLGIFFFSMPSGGLNYWQIVKTIVDKWEEINKLISQTPTPFAYRFSVRSTKIEKLEG
ncbi:MAG TPA: hypothetical protein PKN44_05940 [Bacteroidales bacterium]|nr:hypothetical protein [Bacteroidales bacterium]HPS49785.1 hypothetical protein [Bacteroidales bacterium]